eukprot:300875-Prymnesium_polylepis.1
MELSRRSSRERLEAVLQNKYPTLLPLLPADDSSGDLFGEVEYSRKYKLLVSEQKTNGTIAIVTIIATSVLTKPAKAPASWPH